MRQRIGSFHACWSYGIFRNFLKRPLKICAQIKWICQMKKDSVASLVHNNLFRSFIMTTRCAFLCWILWYFWKFSMIIIKDLHSNKVDCAKLKNRKIPKYKQKYHGDLIPVLYDYISFCNSYGIYSYLLLSLKIFHYLQTKIERELIYIRLILTSRISTIY